MSGVEVVEWSFPSRTHLAGDLCISPSCSGWQNTKELSSFLKELKGKKASEDHNIRKENVSSSVNEVLACDTTETNDFFPEADVHATLGKKACLAFALSGISFNTADKDSFKDYLRYFAQIHRAKQVKSTFLGPNRHELSNTILPELHNAVKHLTAETVIPSLISFSFELSIDGYSTGTTPRHNIIVASNGRSFYIGCIPAGCSEQDQEHIADIICFGTSEVSKLIQTHSDPNLVGLMKSRKTVEEAQKIIWLTLDGATVNAAAVSLLQVSMTNTLCCPVIVSLTLSTY
ncbi:hypothetical protein GEMRC1_008840 [Eukaryota sp. GEM-RC1]